jgi:ketosteroid isomerase-like protein
MKRMIVFSGVALSLLWCVTPHSRVLHATENSAAKQIADMESKWAEAQKAGNAAAVAPLLAATFVNTDVDAQTYGKEKLLANLKGGQWEHNAISEVKVTVYGNAAVATGAWSGKGIDGDGTKIDRAERWTDTWVKMPDGKWQCVASQQTAMPKK